MGPVRLPVAWLLSRRDLKRSFRFGHFHPTHCRKNRHLLPACTCVRHLLSRSGSAIVRFPADRPAGTLVVRRADRAEAFKQKSRM